MYSLIFKKNIFPVSRKLVKAQMFVTLTCAVNDFSWKLFIWSKSVLGMVGGAFCFFFFWVCVPFHHLEINYPGGGNVLELSTVTPLPLHQRQASAPPLSSGSDKSDGCWHPWTCQCVGRSVMAAPAAPVLTPGEPLILSYLCEYEAGGCKGGY